MMVVTRSRMSRSFVEEISETDSPEVIDALLCQRIATRSREKQLPEEVKARIIVAIRHLVKNNDPLEPENPPPCGE